MEDIKDTIKNLVILILLLLIPIGYFSLKRFHKEEIKKINNSYSSVLQDTLTPTQTKTDTFWRFDVSQLTPEDIINSPIYQDLSKREQALLQQLKKEKNLVASMNVKITAQKEYIEVLEDSLFWVKDSLFQAKDGTVITFQDTAGAFQYNENITLSDPIRRVAKYSLNLEPDIRIKKLNKYSVEGEIRFKGLEDLDDIVITHQYSYYSSLSPKEIKKAKTFAILKPIGFAISHSLALTAGYKLGEVIHK